MTEPSTVCAYLYVISKYGYPPPAAQTTRHLEEMRNLGFRSVELEGIREQHLRQISDRREEIAATLARLELRVPYFCVVLPALASADARERARSLELFRLGCEVAAHFGAKGVLDNGPLPPYAFPGDVPVVRHFDEALLQAAPIPRDLSWPIYWNDLVVAYRAACDVAAGFGLTYQLHPCLGALGATTDGFLHLRDAVGRDNLRFNLDTANLFMMRENLALSLRRLGDAVDYIHLSDNRGNRVEHLVPGEGSIRWEAFFEALELVGFAGDIGLDIGGAESEVGPIDEAYERALAWLRPRWPQRRAG